MWKAKIRIKHLFSKNEDYQSIQISMNNIADILKTSNLFSDFDFSLFRKIPRDNEFFKSVEYANKLIDRMYDFANANRIWIE